MRKYRLVAVAAAGVMVLTVPAGAALAAGTHSAAAKPVLRVGKASGAAVKKGAKLSAGLAKGQKVNLAIGSFAATCTKSSFAAKVVKNPASAGKATISVTSETLGGCSLTGIPKSTASLSSITAVDLPYNGSITTKNKLTVSGTKKSRPIGFAAHVVALGTPIVCVFTAASNSGKTANKANSITFTKQTLTLNKTQTPSGSLGLCEAVGKAPYTSVFSAVFGPVRDTSVKHHPKVFVG
jgi:hypothetical protein